MILILIAVLALQITYLVKSIMGKNVENKVLIFDISSFVLTICVFLIYRDSMDKYAFYYEFGLTRIYFMSILTAIASYFVVNFITIFLRFVYSKGNSTSSICTLFAIPMMLIGVYLLYLELDNNLSYTPTPAVVLSVEEKHEFTARSDDNPTGLVYRPIVQFYRNDIKETRAVDMSYFEDAMIQVGGQVDIYIIEVRNEQTGDEFTIIKPQMLYFEKIYIPMLVIGAILMFIAISTAKTLKKYTAPQGGSENAQYGYAQPYYEAQEYDTEQQYDDGAQEYEYEPPYYGDYDKDNLQEAEQTGYSDYGSDDWG